jgi:peptidoglycan hydrolase-like protein with peptidoglycan-binding domain
LIVVGRRGSGNFGPDTRAAVIAFQAWGDVPQSGIVDDQMWVCIPRYWRA